MVGPQRFTSRLVCSPDGEARVVAVLSPTVSVAATVLTSRPFGANGLVRWAAEGTVMVAHGATGLRTASVGADHDELSLRRLARAASRDLHRHVELRLDPELPSRLTHAVELDGFEDVPARAGRLLRF